ncbi:porin [Dickeya sp. CFBP 2040]|uniref:porin n=1 Tax=Dickeya sp. CFBP 2040 TaxID=2718531 RepID=UPI001447E049|nr:porin [Dickeya sp. CFBP 2040]NKI74538.1 porin [Dickeya sp. CFBP 2040]
MKHLITMLTASVLLSSTGLVNAAEVYNNQGNKFDLYGKVRAGYYFGDNTNSFKSNGDSTYARLGVKGETQITPYITGYGNYEYHFDASKAEDTNGANGKTRYAYAGLKFDKFGSIDYGRNKGIAYDGLSYTDVLPEFGGDQGYTDNITGRTAGVATYRNKNFFGLVDGWDIGLQYQSSHNDSTDPARQVGNGWGVSSAYTTPVGIGVIASYEAVSRTAAQRATNEGDKADAWAAGVKYDANRTYLAMMYGILHNLTPIGTSTAAFADKTKIFEAVAQYHFDFGLTPSLAYVSARAYDETDIGQGTSGYVTRYASLGVNYTFNKNMVMNVAYLRNLISSTDNPFARKTGDTVFTGLVYQF